MELQPGTFLQEGKYKIERVLGQGGFGITYLGLQMGLNRKVAIKEFFMKDFCERITSTSEMRVSQASQENVNHFRNKFLKEAQNIAQMDNPHIVHIYDIFEENGTAYYVMEYMEEGSLDDLVKRKGRLSEAEAAGYISQVADALEYIHARNILHLDIKPSNILLRKDQVVLIDFGVSKRYGITGEQTSTTPACISKGYAPIEQYTQGGIATFTPSADIYSLGATFYKLLTGITPPEAVLLSEEGLPALPNSISSLISNAIHRAMLPGRKNRPQNISEFLSLLEEKVNINASLFKDEDTKLYESVEDSSIHVKNCAKSRKKGIWHGIIILLFALNLFLLFDTIIAISFPIVDDSEYNTLTICHIHSPLLNLYYGSGHVVTQDFGEKAATTAFQKAMTDYKADVMPKLWILVINMIVGLLYFIYKGNKYYTISVIIFSFISFIVIISG